MFFVRDSETCEHFRVASNSINTEITTLLHRDAQVDVFIYVLGNVHFVLRWPDEQHIGVITFGWLILHFDHQPILPLYWQLERLQAAIALRSDRTVNKEAQHEEAWLLVEGQVHKNIALRQGAALKHFKEIRPYFVRKGGFAILQPYKRDPVWRQPVHLSSAFREGESTKGQGMRGEGKTRAECLSPFEGLN